MFGSKRISELESENQTLRDELQKIKASHEQLQNVNQHMEQAAKENYQRPNQRGASDDSSCQLRRWNEFFAKYRRREPNHAQRDQYTQ